MANDVPNYVFFRAYVYNISMNVTVIILFVFIVVVGLFIVLYPYVQPYVTTVLKRKSDYTPLTGGQLESLLDARKRALSQQFPTASDEDIQQELSDMQRDIKNDTERIRNMNRPRDAYSIAITSLTGACPPGYRLFTFNGGQRMCINKNYKIIEVQPDFTFMSVVQFGDLYGQLQSLRDYKGVEIDDITYVIRKALL